MAVARSPSGLPLIAPSNESKREHVRDRHLQLVWSRISVALASFCLVVFLFILWSGPHQILGQCKALSDTDARLACRNQWNLDERQFPAKGGAAFK